MKTLIAAYRVHVTRAHRMDELGAGLSLQPWGSDTREYEGNSEPVAVELLAGATCEETEGAGRAIFPAGSDRGMPLSEAVALGLARVADEVD